MMKVTARRIDSDDWLDLAETSEADNLRAFRRRLRQSLPRFLAYCSIMRACRPYPQVRRGRPVVIALVCPRGAEFNVYEDAARYAVYGPAITYHGYPGTGFLRRPADGKKDSDAEVSEALASQPRVVLIASDFASVPKSLEYAADALVQVMPILPRHVVAAARVCLKQTVTQEQAEFIASLPLTVIGSALRRGRSVLKAIDLMKRATAPEPSNASEPTLGELHGLGEASEWGRELATDLADWKVGRIGWRDVDRGILLSGPPGTGKTTFAGALARSCGAHLVLGSIARWQAKGHLGDLLRAMRAAFDEAKANVPSIVFLDEIDAVGDRSQFHNHNSDYSIQVVAGLLECIDGAEGREGVVVVGACNHPHKLDSALVRAGRLDRHIRISLPDTKGREGILRWHLQELIPEADLSGIAAMTHGWNGASLEQLVRAGRRKARRQRRDLTLEDLAGELPIRTVVPTAVRRRAAFHEAGHAVVNLYLDAAELVSVSVANTIRPHVDELQDGGGVTFKAKAAVQERTRAQFLDDIAVKLGGLAAEEVMLGDRSAGGGGVSGSDLHAATLLALTFEASYGLGEGLAYLAPEDEAELFSALRLDRQLRARVDKVLTEQLARAKLIVKGHRQEVERIAESVLLKDTLLAAEFLELIACCNGDDRRAV